MRRLIIVALAVMLTAAPVSAQTEYQDFASRLAPLSQTWGEPQSPEAARQAAERVAAFILPVLLSTTPDECYTDGYVAMWRVYAAAYQVAQTDPLDSTNLMAYLAMFTTNVEEATTLLVGAVCGG